MLGHLHRLCAYAVLALLFLSGAAHYALHGWCQAQGEFGPVPDPLEPWMLKLHGAAAMLSLVLLGSVLSTHIHRFWHLGRNRRAGGAFLACVLLLIGSGYGLYYLGGDQARALCRQLHIVIGLLSLPLFAAHLWRGWALRPYPGRHPRGRQAFNPRIHRL
jgi:hypothetical protein